MAVLRNDPEQLGNSSTFSVAGSSAQFLTYLGHDAEDGKTQEMGDEWRLKRKGEKKVHVIRFQEKRTYGYDPPESAGYRFQCEENVWTVNTDYDFILMKREKFEDGQEQNVAFFLGELFDEASRYQFKILIG